MTSPENGDQAHGWGSRPDDDAATAGAVSSDGAAAPRDGSAPGSGPRGGGADGPAVRNRPARDASGRFVRARPATGARTVAAADDASALGKVTAKVQEQDPSARQAGDTARQAGDTARQAGETARWGNEAARSENDEAQVAAADERAAQDAVLPAKDASEATLDRKDTIRSQNGANQVDPRLSGEKLRSGRGGAEVPAWVREADVAARKPGSPEEVSVDGRTSSGRWAQDPPRSGLDRPAGPVPPLPADMIGSPSSNRSRPMPGLPATERPAPSAPAVGPPAGPPVGPPAGPAPAGPAVEPSPPGPWPSTRSSGVDFPAPAAQPDQPGLLGTSAAFAATTPFGPVTPPPGIPIPPAGEPVQINARPAPSAAAGPGAGILPGAAAPGTAGPGAAGPGAPMPGPASRGGTGGAVPGGAAVAPPVGMRPPGPAGPAGLPGGPPAGWLDPAGATGAAGTKGRPPRPQQTGRAQPGAGQAKAPRRAQLAVVRIEPWSVMKFSFVISLVFFIVLFVAVAVLYGALAGLGVFDSLQKTISTVTSGQGSSGVNAATWFSASRILGYAGLIGAVNVVLITAISTVGAVLYNVASDLVGGVEVTLRETE